VRKGKKYAELADTKSDSDAVQLDVQLIDLLKQLEGQDCFSE